jgi:hypothetical protein
MLKQVQHDVWKANGQQPKAKKLYTVFGAVAVGNRSESFGRC